MIPISDEIELAWAAGFFDGEGCVSIIVVKSGRGRPEGYMNLHMKVSQVRREPLDRFHKAVGVGNVTGPYRRPIRHQPIYMWQAGGTPACRDALAKLWPHLSGPKRNQASEAIIRLEFDLQQNPRDYFKQLRERILRLRADGLAADQIASAVGRSRRTIRYHLQRASQEVM